MHKPRSYKRIGGDATAGGTHTFLETTLFKPTDCDLCHQFIWGVTKQAHRCTECKMTIHSKCVAHVQGPAGMCKNVKKKELETNRFFAKKTDFAQSDTTLDIDQENLVITSRKLNKTERLIFPLREIIVTTRPDKRRVTLRYGVKEHTYMFESEQTALDFKYMLKCFVPAQNCEDAEEVVPVPRRNSQKLIAELTQNDADTLRSVEGKLTSEEKLHFTNLQKAFEKGLVDEERYNLERHHALMNVMDRLNGKSHFTQQKKQENKAGESEEKILNFDLHDIPEERAIKKTYNWSTKAWETKEVTIKVDYDKPFAAGAMRNAYKMLDFSRQEGYQKCVAKVWKPEYQHEDREGYFLDVEMQVVCQALAKEFNSFGPPKKVSFVDAFIIERKVPGLPESESIMAVEPYIQGKYEKYSNNNGFVSFDERNTPHAFSHFTYSFTNERMMVVDIQGVGDVYTDPQIHTADGRGYGAGNLGKSGMSKFFETHKCSSVCRFLQIDDGKGNDDEGTVIRSRSSKSAKKQWKGSEYVRTLEPIPKSAAVEDLTLFGLSMDQFNKLCNMFNEFKSPEGEVAIDDFLPLLEALGLQLDSSKLASMVRNVDRDGNGAISFMELLFFWCGIE